MPTTNTFSTAVVLSPGAWRYVMDSGNGTDRPELSAQRLATVMSRALTSLGQRRQRRSMTLNLEPSINGGSSSSPSQNLQLTHITSAGKPSFLLIRLPDEAPVDY